ncbi:MULTISPECIES: hypothetical protein [Aphanothece]|uniref:hypothetical protein n=1 Tax=Aphanothece TaxID=1121 RepID=UPI003984A946
MSEFVISGLPGWISKSEKESRKASRLTLLGNARTWAGQPVVARVKIKAKGKNGDGDVNRVVVNRAMAASWTYKGNADKDTIIFGAQAGAITKRTNSVIDFGNDKVRDTFAFTNNTRFHGPFNHMQRYVIRNFGKQDVVKLNNIGKTLRFKDLRSYGNGVYGFNGVPLDKLRITLTPDQA